MKSFLIILLYFLLITQMHYPQWTNQNPVPYGNDLWSTFFVDDNTGWIVGSDGFIKKTTNAGVDWVQQNSSTTSTLKSVQFVDQNTGWICGESGLILKTTNGGLNWDSLASGTTQHLTDIHFCDLDTGYVVGFSGIILKTTDGGLAWMSQSSGTSAALNSLDFVNPLLGFTAYEAEDSIYILKTTDGGMNWISKIIRNNYQMVHTVEFIDANTGFIGGGVQSSGFIYKTTDGGNTWGPSASIQFEPQAINQKEQLGIYDAGGINSIYFKDSNIGYAVLGGVWGCVSERKIYKTTDGGNTWNQTYRATEQNGLISVFVNDEGKGSAVGFSGIIILTEDDGNSWKQILSGAFSNNSSGDDIFSIFNIDENIGWSVGGREDCLTGGSVILKTTNGGKIWKTKLDITSTNSSVRSVYFINEFFGWAVSSQSIEQTTTSQEVNRITAGQGIYRTTDGGENWAVTELIDASSVFFVNQDTGWVTSGWGNSIGIYKSIDGGITWTQKSSVSSSSVYFSDIYNGWAVGASGSLLKSTDGGETWVTKTSGTTNDLSCIKFYNSNLGMCVGNAGTALLSTDGGESWISQNVGTTAALKTVSFTNSTTVWVDGYNGTILKTTDLGYSWTSYSGVTENNLTSLSFINEYTGWFGGMNGTMFKYYEQPTAPLSPTNLTALADTFSTTLNWIDNSSNEIGFVIERKDGDSLSISPYIAIGTLISDLTSAIDTGLTYNTTYTYRVFAYNNIGNSDYSNIRQVTTFNVAPSSPINLTAVADTFSVELNWTDNSDNETGFVLERKEGDSLSVNPYIRIDSVMANITSIADTGLTPNTIYTYRVFAYNNIGNSDYSNLKQITTISLPLKFQLTVSLLDGWNIVSIPGLHPVNQNVTTWWSGKDQSASVYKFSNGYQSINTAELRTGYWMKNLGDQTYSTGDEWPANGILVVSHDAISANAGWNLIGGYEYNAAVSGITTTPPGLQNSPVYKYSGGYQMADYIIPGYGYWIKLTSAGQINIPSGTSDAPSNIAKNTTDGFGKIIITDNTGKSYTLYATKGEINLTQYELPPQPPQGIFDIRYSSQRYVERLCDSPQSIEMMGIEHPIKVRAEGIEIIFSDETGKEIARLKDGEEVRLNTSANKLMVKENAIPSVYSLEQNYPNPFNPSTVIEFSLPEDVSNVKLSVYNALGEKVAELVNTSLTAGRYNYQWNAQNVSTGMYIYELRTDKFVSVKKMVLMK
jgi:photosystem II stability/assembly factor-like uncharacterized protein